MAPNSPDARNNLGVTLQQQGKYEKAIEAFNVALSLNPDHSESHNNIGISLLDMGN